ncbi:L-histidine N(alpha)-methyltransferase [Pseudomonas sp. LRF_L74]|uniref:L-histidine N(alpha)-methyltransferase n=1 Tax=Pseudomonas sp. LRF_L74 TaxID=3369422 RepID=UPI003F60894B
MALAICYHEHYRQHDTDALREAVLLGLAGAPKSVPPRFFYDRRGLELYDKICRLPEYYQSRTEEMILRLAANQIAHIVGPGSSLVELGCGTGRMARFLLDALRPARYLGIDISHDDLLAGTHRLAADYPWLEVHASCADFSQPLDLPTAILGRPVLAFFPGSGIGNYDLEEASALLRNLHQALPEGAGLLIGVDLVKDKATLETAYNDKAGVTAAFNLNMLQRIRNELDSDIDPRRFEHLAFYNQGESRIEMHLRSKQAQQVWIEGQRFDFATGETLHTENAYKYTPATFRELAAQSAFHSEAMWVDPWKLFSVHYLRRE